MRKETNLSQESWNFLTIYQNASASICDVIAI